MPGPYQRLPLDSRASDVGLLRFWAAIVAVIGAIWLAISQPPLWAWIAVVAAAFIAVFWLRRWRGSRELVEAAADAYDRAARAGIEPGESGYTAARIRFGSLGDAAGALRSLDAAGVENGPLAERALGLRARALVRLGRTTEARAAAQRYLSRYPAGGLAPFMREQLEASE